jgi:hypothetical protein
LQSPNQTAVFCKSDGELKELPKDADADAKHRNSQRERERERERVRVSWN